MIRSVARNVLVPAIVDGLAGVLGTTVASRGDDAGNAPPAPANAIASTASERFVLVPVEKRLGMDGAPAGDRLAERPVTQVDAPTEQAPEPTAEEVMQERQERFVEPFLLEPRENAWASRAERTLGSSFAEYLAAVGDDMVGLELRELECRGTRCLARVQLPVDPIASERARRGVVDRLVFGTDPDSGNCPLHTLPTDENGVWTIVFDCTHRRTEDEQ